MKITNNSMGNKVFLVFGLSLFLVSLVGGVAYQYKDQIYQQLEAFKLIPQSEHFTELYFNDYTEILKWQTENKGTAPLSFSFTVHNLEGKDMEYLYRVYFVFGTSTTSIYEGVRAVEDGGYRTITELYAPASSPSQGKGTIFIELPQLNQAIHFSTGERK